MNTITLIIILLVKKLVDANYSSLTEDIGTNPQAPKFKVGDRVKIIKYKNIFATVQTENQSKEIFVTDSVLKTNPWAYKIKDLNRETIIVRFYEKELLLSKL